MYFVFVVFRKAGKIPVTGIRAHVPTTCQKVSRLPTELPGATGEYIVRSFLPGGVFFYVIRRVSVYACRANSAENTQTPNSNVRVQTIILIILIVLIVAEKRLVG